MIIGLTGNGEILYNRVQKQCVFLLHGNSAEMRKDMSKYKAWQQELDRLEDGKSSYTWDELEELITDHMDDEKITMEEFDTLMRRLMEIDCG